MSDYLIHTTGVRDRFDLIAYKYYGDQHRIHAIIDANRALFMGDLSPIPAILPPRLRLVIPVLPQKSNRNQLPPWKR
jgi:phage tail protein X